VPAANDVGAASESMARNRATLSSRRRRTILVAIALFLISGALFAATFCWSLVWIDAAQCPRLLIWAGDFWCLPRPELNHFTFPLGWLPNPGWDLRSGAHPSYQVLKAVFRSGLFGTAVHIPLWLPALLAAAVALVAWSGRPIDPYKCSECGYNLTGNVAGRCPECGSACMPDKRKPTRTGPSPTENL
jgi:hypothetical protein